MKEPANPRLVDVFGCEFTQDQVDFAIPRLREDIPLYIDPFLLWSSENPDYKALHQRLIEFLILISSQVRAGNPTGAASLLAGCTEQRELGLGYGIASKRGSNMGPQIIADVIAVHRDVPQLRDGHIRHVEELQLVVPNLAEDRISDTTASILKDYFIEYTADQAKNLGIPTREVRDGNIFCADRLSWVSAPLRRLPFNPVDGSPILLAPLNLLRHLPWINYPDYYRSSYSPRVAMADTRRRTVAKAAVLAYNARNYVEVERYVVEKERRAGECRPDPLFKPLTSGTLLSKFNELRKLPTGSADGADRKYEDLVSDLLTSLLYPTLEFAESRVRTLSGAHIRDLIFYNDGKTDFWRDLKTRYEARQPVFELKNVKSLDTEHVNQLYRYLDAEFGRFGVLVTRNPMPSRVQRNIVDLHSSKRTAIICLDDRDLELMLSLLGSARDPNEAIKKRFVELTRLLPK